MTLFSDKLLRTFCQVVESGGFSEAQYVLGITQSAISCRMRDLELMLGFKVCQRGRSGFFLTERGRIAYERSRQILNRASDFEAELLEIRETIAGELRIGVVDTILSNEELPIASAFHKFLGRKNDIKIEVKVAPPSELTVDLIHGSIHVGIAPFTQKLGGLNYQPIASEMHKLYCGPPHPLYSIPPEQITPDILRQYPLCQRTYGNNFGITASEASQTALVSNMEAQALLIMSGKYLGVLPVHYARLWERSLQLRELAHDTFVWQSHFCLATRKTPSPRLAISLFTRDFMELV